MCQCIKNAYVCASMQVPIHVPLTPLTFLSPGNASSYLSFIHPAISDQGSFSGTGVCQNRPTPAVSSVLRPERYMSQQPVSMTSTELTISYSPETLLFAFIVFTTTVFFVNAVDSPVGLLSTMAGRKDERTSRYSCCSHSASCTKLQTEGAAPTSVNNPACLSLTGVPSQTK